jgi:putative ABC transport system permease protein
VLLRPLPYKSPDRLVRIEETGTEKAVALVPAANYLLVRERSDLFEEIVPHRKDMVTVTGGSEPDQFFALRTSARLFSFLGVNARLGRALAESDDAFDAPNAAVLSHRLWQRRFHGDPDVIGRAITVSGEVFTVAGVMGPEFEFPDSSVEMWLPLRLTPATKDWLQVVARIRQGVALPQVQGALQNLTRQLEQQDPQKRAGLQLVASPWRQDAEPQYELTLVLILAAVGLVLLIACADVGSLLLSRAVQRQKEIAIRASLGAGFWRVARQLLTESFIMAALGCAAGLLLAHHALQYLSKQLAALPIILPHIQHVALNGRALLLSMVLCLLVTAISCLAPILFASRTDLQAVLRTGQGSGTKGSARLFFFLVASQGALAFLLLVGSGLMVRSVIRLQEADKGFRPDHVLTMAVPLGTMSGAPEKYGTMPLQVAYYDEILERAERVPGVSEVALVNNLPLSRINTSLTMPAPDGGTIGISARIISPRYFAAMGIPLVAGRLFSAADQTAVAIVNEYLAKQLFPDRDPVGQLMPGRTSENRIRIVGIVKDSWLARYDQPMEGELYMSYHQVIRFTFALTMVVRATGDPLSLADALRKEVWAVDPDQPVLKVETMNDVVANSIWRPRFSAWIFSMLGGLALLLTAIGVYAVVAYTTALRMREVGIRIALGATPGNVANSVLRDAMMPLAAGLAAGLGAALLLSHLLASLLYETRNTDPIAYLGAGVLLLGIGVFAGARPAWKAATCEPISVLRAE